MSSNTQTLECADIETSSEAYANRFAGKSGKWLIERQSQILKTFIRQFSSNTVLDVGGGHAQVVQALVDLNTKITVLGSSQKCEARVKVFSTSGKCSFQVGHLEKLSFADHSFDAVTCFRFLSHTDLWQQVISELCRVSCEIVIVDYPVLMSFNLLNPLLFKLKKKFEGNTRSFTIFTHRQILAAFEKNGFKLKKAVRQFFFPMVVHRALKNPGLSNFLEFFPKILGLTYLFGSPVVGCFERRK